MFISSAEKALMQAQIRDLQAQVRTLSDRVFAMTYAPTLQEKPRRTMSLENRAKLSAMMKKRHADEKAKKENK